MTVSVERVSFFAVTSSSQLDYKLTFGKWTKMCATSKSTKYLAGLQLWSGLAVPPVKALFNEKCKSLKLKHEPVQ